MDFDQIELLRTTLNFRKEGDTSLVFVEIPDENYDTSEIEKVLREFNIAVYRVTRDNLKDADVVMLYAQSYLLNQPLREGMPKPPVAIVFSKSLIGADRNSFWQVDYQYGNKVEFRSSATAKTNFAPQPDKAQCENETTLTIRDLPAALAEHKEFLASDGAKGTALYAPGADFSGADLAGQDLRMAVLERAILKGADLRNTDVRNADFRFADLTDAVQSGMNRTGANFLGALGVDLPDTISEERPLAPPSRPPAP